MADRPRTQRSRSSGSLLPTGTVMNVRTTARFRAAAAKARDIRGMILPGEPSPNSNKAGRNNNNGPRTTDALCRQPTYEEYSQVMTGFTPEQIPVLNGLAASR